MKAKNIKNFIDDPDIVYAGVTINPTNAEGESVRIQSSGWEPHQLRHQDDGIIDTVAVVRALRGERLSLSPREVVAAVALGSKHGLSEKALAERLDISGRTIAKTRTRYGIKVPVSFGPGYNRRYDPKEEDAA